MNIFTKKIDLAYLFAMSAACILFLPSLILDPSTFVNLTRSFQKYEMTTINVGNQCFFVSGFCDDISGADTETIFTCYPSSARLEFKEWRGRMDGTYSELMTSDDFKSTIYRKMSSDELGEYIFVPKVGGQAVSVTKSREGLTSIMTELFPCDFSPLLDGDRKFLSVAWPAVRSGFIFETPALPGWIIVCLVVAVFLSIFLLKGCWWLYSIPAILSYGYTFVYFSSQYLARNVLGFSLEWNGFVWGWPIGQMVIQIILICYIFYRRRGQLSSSDNNDPRKHHKGIFLALALVVDRTCVV